MLITNKNIEYQLFETVYINCTFTLNNYFALKFTMIKILFKYLLYNVLYITYKVYI